MTKAVPISMNTWLLQSVFACQIVTNLGITRKNPLTPAR